MSLLRAGQPLGTSAGRQRNLGVDHARALTSSSPPDGAPARDLTAARTTHSGLFARLPFAHRDSDTFSHGAAAPLRPPESAQHGGTCAPRHKPWRGHWASAGRRPPERPPSVGCSPAATASAGTAPTRASPPTRSRPLKEGLIEPGERTGRLRPEAHDRPGSASASRTSDDHCQRRSRHSGHRSSQQPGPAVDAVRGGATHPPDPTSPGRVCARGRRDRRLARRTTRTVREENRRSAVRPLSRRR